MGIISPCVSAFISNFQGGGARPNLYNVIMNFPAAVAGAVVAKKLAFTCKAASLPASNMGIANVPYMGRTVKLAGDKTYDDWTITIVNDTDFIVRDAFEKWLELINGNSNNVSARGWNNPASYLSDAEVIQLDREDKPIKAYKFIAIFPTNIAEISLGYDQNDTVEEFSVTLAVNYWTSNTTLPCDS